MPYTEQQKQQLKGILTTYKSIGGSYYGAGGGITDYQRQTTAPKPLKTSTPGFLQSIENIGKQSAGLVGTGLKKAGGYVLHTGQSVAKDFLGTTKTISDFQTQPMSLAQGQKIQDSLLKTQKSLELNYASGKVSKEKYIQGMKDIATAMQKLNKDVYNPIINGPTPQQRAENLVNTAIDVLSMGTYKPVVTGVKAAGEGFVLRETKTGFINSLTKNIEDVASKIPAVKDLVARNTKLFDELGVKQLVGETTQQMLQRNSKRIAVGLLIKRPIVYEINIGLAEDAYNNLLTGNYGQAARDSAWIGVQAVGGGPLGWAGRNLKKFGIKVKELSHGTNSYIDEISKQIGDGSPTQIGRWLQGLKTENPEKFKEAEQTLRILETTNLHMADNNVAHAVEATLKNYKEMNVDLSYLTPEQLISDMQKWKSADEIARIVSEKLQPGEPVKYVAVRWDTPTKNAVANAVKAAGDDYQKMVDAVYQIADQPSIGFGNNQILMSKIGKIISSSRNADEAAQGIKKIETASIQLKDIPKREAKKLADAGYTLAEPRGGRKTPVIDYKDTQKLVSKVSHGDKELFDPTTDPHPILHSISGILEKFGLSPESNTRVAYDKLAESMVGNIEQAGIARELGVVGEESRKGAQFILSKLQAYIEKQAPNPWLNVGTLGRGQQSALQDIRQMTIKEIREALPGTSTESAKKLQKVIMKSYLDVPLEFRGLGVKAFDQAYRLPGAKSYYRIQSALRYVYNPFFRTQEVIETKMLSHLRANNLLWFKAGETPSAVRARLDSASKLLDDAKLFTTGYTGEATQDLTIGRIHANLLKTQKRDLAGLALDIAEKRGITLERMVQEHPDELADALRVIVQYPTKGVLNSPLARTLNVAFFPMRYNLKVAGIAAQKIAELPPTVQTAVIHSIFKTSDWLKSDEGIKWQAQYADAIKLFQYFSVTGNIQSVYSTLMGHNHSISQWGLMGGLPFGVITQILENEGIISISTPYVDPKTGTVLPDYIPTTTKARAAVALESLINSTFTYPGRIIGMPGKAQLIRGQVNGLLKTNQSEYTKEVRGELTPLQQRTIEVLTNPNVTQEQIDQLYMSPAQGEYNWYTLPSLAQPVHVYTRQEVAALKAKKPSSSKTKTKKKALPIPARGQSL